MTSPRYKWAVVGMLWFICFFNYADRQAIFSIFPLLKSHFGFTDTHLGIIGMAFTWVYALSAPFAGQVGDRFSRKTVILCGLYLWSLITGFTALCSKVWHFVLVRGTEGLGETFYFPASMSLISDYHTRLTRSRAMSIHQTSVYAGTIGGGALAGWLAQEYGWQYPFLLLGGAGMVLGVVLGIFIREPRRNEAERLEHREPLDHTEPQRLPLRRFLGELLRTPTAVLLVAAFFGANFVALVFLVWMPTFLKEKFGLTLAVAGLGATFFIQVASMIGSVLGGLLADRWSRRWAGGRIIVQSIALLLGAPFIFLCGSTRDLGTLVAAMTLFGLCKGLYDANIWASLYDVIAPSRRGTAVGLMNMIGWFGGGLGSLFIGVVVDMGMTMSFAIALTAIVYLAVAGMLFVAAVGFAPRDVARRTAWTWTEDADVNVKE
jgi:MFS family permease